MYSDDNRQIDDRQYENLGIKDTQKKYLLE